MTNLSPGAIFNMDIQMIIIVSSEMVAQRRSAYPGFAKFSK